MAFIGGAVRGFYGSDCGGIGFASLQKARDACTQSQVRDPNPKEMENPSEEHEQAMQEAMTSLDRELRSRTGRWGRGPTDKRK